MNSSSVQKHTAYPHDRIFSLSVGAKCMPNGLCDAPGNTYIPAGVGTLKLRIDFITQKLNLHGAKTSTHYEHCFYRQRDGRADVFFAAKVMLVLFFSH